MSDKLGLILYTLRDYCTNESDLDETLAKVRSIGYKNVQVSGIGPIKPEVVRSLCDKNDIKIIAAHDGTDGLRADIQSVIGKLQTYGCDFTALGHPGPAFDWKAENLNSFIKELRSWCETFKEVGLKFGYHNHANEFQKYNGKIMLDTLYDEIPADVLYAELDVYWVTRGGCNPVDYIKKVYNRMPVIHYKDFAVVDAQPTFCEVGEGNLDWPSINKACVDAGVKYHVVEQDAPFMDRDIFESIKISYNNLVKMGM